MGRKKNRVKVDESVKSDYDYTREKREEFDDIIDPRLVQAQQRADDLYNRSLGGWEDLRARVGQGTARPGFEELSRTGGWTPEAVGNQRANINRYKNIYDTGGGDGVYREFAQTGGWNDADKANYRARTASMTPSLFATMKSNMDRRNRVQGGYGPDYSSVMARDASRGLTDAVREGELSLGESVREGRLAGAEGVSRNQFGALAGMSDLEQNLMESIISGRQFGLGGLASEDRRDDSLLGDYSRGVQGLRESTPGEEFGFLDRKIGANTDFSRLIQNLIGLQGDEDSRRWGKKRDVLNAGAGVGAAAAGRP